MEVDNDKSPILFIVFYGLIILTNLSLWITFRVLRKQLALPFKKISLVLLLALIPLLAFVINY